MFSHFFSSSQFVFVAVAIALYLLSFSVGRGLKRGAGVQLGFTYQIFCLALAVYVPVHLVLHYQQGAPWNQWLFTLLLLTGTLFVIALLNRYFWELYFIKRGQAPAPKFFSQVAAILLVAMVLLFVYQKEVPGLIAGSAVLSIILGLALQDLLGNIIAGFAIYFGRPYKAGDWLQIEKCEAEVMEINWRSTRLRTSDDTYLDIPNSTITKQTVINFNYPTRSHAMRLEIGIDYGTPPNTVKDALLRAAAKSFGVLPEPGPSVFLHSFGDSAIVYQIKFYMEDHREYSRIQDSIRTNAWYELRRARILIPFPIRTLQIERKRTGAPESRSHAAAQALRRQPYFARLKDEQLGALLGQGATMNYGRGERIIEQGHEGDSMFILIAGNAEVLVEIDGAQTSVAQLGAGDCFGEMSLLTGERRSATVQARVDCEVVEITKADMAAVLAENPEVLEDLGDLLAERRLENEGIIAEASQRSAETKERRQEYKASFLWKLRSFFEL